jgi:hypothetical protein
MLRIQHLAFFMNRQTTYYATLAISTLAVLLLPFPDHSGHGIYASILAFIALTGTIVCIVFAITSFFRKKAVSPNLEMSLWLAISPIAQILLISLLGKDLSLEDLFGVLWMGCAWLSELCAIPLLIAITVRAICKTAT